MICKHCGIEDSEATPDDPQEIECDISCPNRSPCDPCKELANLEKLMARLVQRRSELKRTINRIHSPFIHRIPSEIIAKISGFTITNPTIGIGSSPTLILLSSICSDWRQIVVGTPQLWSSIQISLPFHSEIHDMVNSKVLYLATLTEEWLARSGQLPLHISLCISPGHHNVEIHAANTPEKYHTIFEILNRYSSRWRALDISIPSTLFSYLRPDCLPLLEQLHISLGAEHDEYQSTMTFPPSPCLKEVGIAKGSSPSFYILPSLPDFRIQWDNVTHMYAEQLTVRESLNLLCLIPQLIHGEFHNIVNYIWDDDEEPSPEPPIPSILSYLALSCDQGYLGRFFESVVLPSLETLVVSDLSDMDALTTCLKRSACSLHTLSLENSLSRDSDSLMPLLQLLSPSLKKLEVTGTTRKFGVDLTDDSYQQYLSILTKTYSSQTQNTMGDDFLPHLETFKFGKGFRSSNSTNCLPNLPSRNHPKLAIPIPLRSVHIDLSSIPKPIPPDISSLLERLNEDGIVVTFE